MNKNRTVHATRPCSYHNCMTRIWSAAIASVTCNRQLSTRIIIVPQNTADYIRRLHCSCSSPRISVSRCAAYAVAMYWLICCTQLSWCNYRTHLPTCATSDTEVITSRIVTEFASITVKQLSCCARVRILNSGDWCSELNGLPPGMYHE